MKKITILLAFTALTGMFTGCLYQPKTTYSYWKFSAETQLYSVFCSEAQLTADEMEELGLVDKLPENAKTIE